MPPTLAIVVPYRDRQQHLDVFLPHLCAFFSEDPAARDIPVEIHIVEQEPGAPFNRGMIKNIGFDLTCKASTYTCFHDVDYLPVNADYSPTSGLCGIVWYGAEQLLISPETGETLPEDLNTFFGGAVLLGNDCFRAINGYPNDYWGWGWEDAELRARCQGFAFPCERRKGTFRKLPHRHEGYASATQPTAANLLNFHQYSERWLVRTESNPYASGLQTLDYRVLRSVRIPTPPQDRRGIAITMTTVSIPWN